MSLFILLIYLFFSGDFPASFKAAVVKPLLKKPCLNSEILKKIRPVSNLPFLSKLIEKVIARRLFAHLQDNGIMEKFQSAYKAKHSTETALLRVYNDVMLCIDQGKGCILVLLDLSAAFDTVDHTVLFNLLEHSLGISGSALSLLKSYLHGRSQCVQIDGITSEFADLRSPSRLCFRAFKLLYVYVPVRFHITPPRYKLSYLC